MSIHNMVQAYPILVHEISNYLPCYSTPRVRALAEARARRRNGKLHSDLQEYAHTK